MGTKLMLDGKIYDTGIKEDMEAYQKALEKKRENLAMRSNEVKDALPESEAPFVEKVEQDMGKPTTEDTEIPEQVEETVEELFDASEDSLVDEEPAEEIPTEDTVEEKQKPKKGNKNKKK